MDTDSVRLSHAGEAIGILNSDGVSDRLNAKAEKIHRGMSYIINDRMLLILMDLGDQIAEAHIAQSKSNWPSIHEDIETAIEFIANLGFVEIYTNVRSELKKTINLLTKHNFRIDDTIQSEVILKWESKQHY